MLMKDSFWSDNKYYFMGLIVVWLLGFVLYWTIQAKGDELVWLNQHSSPSADTFFFYATQLAEVGTYIAVLILLCFLKWQYFFELLILSIVTINGSFLLKNIFQMPRPKHYFGVLNRLDEFHFLPNLHINSAPDTSFPSGHTFAAFILFGYLAFISNKNSSKLYFLSLAISVGISRMYLIQHFMEDVLAGALFGTLTLLITYFLLQKIEWAAWTKKGILGKNILS